jgi:FAD synthase
MKTSVHGTTTRPALAMVGVWDPLMPHHREVITQLRIRAQALERDAAIVMIDPSPNSVGRVAHRYGTGGWPIYDCPSTRVELILGLGVDAVICVRFQRADFASSAAAFLDVVTARIDIEELWLGAVQLLGQGKLGDGAAVTAYADKHNIRVVELPIPPVYGLDVRYLIAQGRLGEATAMVGHPPVRCWSPCAPIELAWCRGRYAVARVGRAGAIDYDDLLELELAGDRSSPGVIACTNQQVEKLAFLLGPADHLGTDIRSRSKR